jgi:hypothetical protein
MGGVTARLWRARYTYTNHKLPVPGVSSLTGPGTPFLCPLFHICIWMEFKGGRLGPHYNMSLNFVSYQIVVHVQSNTRSRNCAGFYSQRLPRFCGKSVGAAPRLRLSVYR